MKDELKYIFGNVNDWLKYAEAKHAGLLVLNSAIIIGVISSYSKGFFYKYPLFIAVFMFGISIFISLIAQYPKTSNYLIRYKEIINPNIYFFGDLAKIKMADFIAEFKQSYPGFVPDNSDKNLINQILINAKITQLKFMLFKFNCYITSLGIIIIGVSTIIKVLWH